MEHPNIVSREEWLTARKALLAKEKAFTHERERLAAERRTLPMVRVEEDYRFQTNAGEKSLADLFGPHSQLIVYHFMFGPEWDEGCPSCSFWADTFNGTDVHLAARDTAFVAIANAPLEKLNAYAKRLGWTFNMVSTGGSSFSADFGVSFYEGEPGTNTEGYNYGGKIWGEEMPGVSVFTKLEDGTVCHTYSTFARGLDILNGAYHFLDMTPKGRDEGDLPFTMAWIRRNDQYA